MLDKRLKEKLTPWIESFIGIPLSKLSDTEVPIFTTESPIGMGKGDQKKLVAIEIRNKRVIVVNDEDLLFDLKPLIYRLTPPTIFSTYGFFELSRVTLEYGISVWGPDWFLFCDEASVNTESDPRVNQIGETALSEVDYKEFWHCDSDALTGFAIKEENNVVALATVTERNHPVFEIGMEVSRNSQGTGMGRAVVSAAARWILETGHLPMAVLSPFNIPSMRTLTSSGLGYLFQCMSGTTQEFKVPPQPLGSPRPSTKMYNLYPGWAMNKRILPKE